MKVHSLNFKVIFLVLLFVSSAPLCAVLNRKVTPSEALDKLKAGNDRFVKEKLLHPRRDIELRGQLTEGQNPIAVILSCSDSRVSPEIFFDQGIGDVFIIRVAGNVLGTLELESIKYAVMALKTPLIMVLGHEKCGAVKAVLSGQTKLIPEIAEKIYAHCNSKNLEKCIKQNVLGVVESIKKAEGIGALLKKGQVGIAGGYYELASGRVAILTDQ